MDHEIDRLVVKSNEIMLDPQEIKILEYTLSSALNAREKLGQDNKKLIAESTQFDEAKILELLRLKPVHQEPTEKKPEVKIEEDEL